MHFAEMDVAQLVKQNKNCIADDEFHPVNSLLFRKVLKSRLVLERTRNLFDSLLK